MSRDISIRSGKGICGGSDERTDSRVSSLGPVSSTNQYARGAIQQDNSNAVVVDAEAGGSTSTWSMLSSWEPSECWGVCRLFLKGGWEALDPIDVAMDLVAVQTKSKELGEWIEDLQRARQLAMESQELELGRQARQAGRKFGECDVDVGDSLGEVSECGKGQITKTGTPNAWTVCVEAVAAWSETSRHAGTRSGAE